MRPIAIGIGMSVMQLLKLWVGTGSTVAPIAVR
jgi:hypothetical protein